MKIKRIFELFVILVLMLCAHIILGSLIELGGDSKRVLYDYPISIVADVKASSDGCRPAPVELNSKDSKIYFAALYGFQCGEYRVVVYCGRFYADNDGSSLYQLRDSVTAYEYMDRTCPCETTGAAKAVVKSSPIKTRL